MPGDDRLDPDLIQANLRAERIGRKVVVFEQTSSTNDIAAQYAGNPDHDGLAVFAEQQTAGRGRTGAPWHSTRGDSLLFSVLLIDTAVAGELLSLTWAVGVAEALGQVGSHQTRIKWPNDLVLSGRKVGGILLESRQNGAGRAHVIGAGINCHQRAGDFPAELRQTATSLDLTGGTRCDRITLARRLLTSLDHWLAVAGRDRRKVTDAWSSLSTQLGHRVILVCDGKRFAGNCIGVDPDKGLILQLDRGGVRIFDAAHTHIVKTP
jgi:BirA family biotin operon repressor/biotin-[acetyl-CoA-carboxylase] ligase